MERHFSHKFVPLVALALWHVGFEREKKEPSSCFRFIVVMFFGFNRHFTFNIRQYSLAK
jgi:hypothetical protein